MLIKNCKICGKNFRTFPSKQSNFCSLKCVGKYKTHKSSKIKHTCPVCKTEFFDWVSRHRTYCSEKCSIKASEGKLPWNTGKKMSKEHCEKLSLAHKGKKNPHIGVPRTEETKKKISNYWKTHTRIYSLETRQKYSRNMIYKMKNRIICSKDTKIERLMEKELSSRNIKYEKQFKYGIGIADFFLSELNAIIECDGIYWHSRPEVAERDKRKNEYAEISGWRWLGS